MEMYGTEINHFWTQKVSYQISFDFIFELLYRL